MENVMIDLETLGTKTNACILSIGAVEFDETGLGDTFYRVVSLSDCLALGLTVDSSTIKWWLKQNEVARCAILKKSTPLVQVLNEFRDFIGNKNTTKVWGNGASFDNVLLRTAYEITGIVAPWKWWNDRCYRTLKNLYKDIQPFTENAAAHNALADAVHQAQHASEILKHIGSADNG